jgi:hypothetical protein
MKKIILFAGLILSVSAVSAQEKGYLTGSFETTDHIYVKDEANRFIPNDDRFGSNNYLKLDYYNGNFSAGLQMEGYYPAIIGYPSDLNKFALSNFYVNWKDDDFQITAGTFYDQFGSGLLFRSWEDRALGLNNSVMGARVTYNFRDVVAVKALWGMPRFGMKFSDTQVRGADASFAISNLVGWDRVYLAVEGSVLDRYEKLDVNMEAEGLSPNRLGYSARVNLDVDGFFFKGEYVSSGNKYFDVRNYIDQYDIPYLTKNGNAQLVETGYTGKGLGVSLSLRRLEWMDSKIVAGGGAPEVNMMNYVPALCTQYTYMLANLHPYGPRTGEIGSRFVNSGEIGGQFDIFYNFRRGTALGGKRGMKVHANFSTYYTIAQEGTFKTGNMLFRDLSVDIEKQWTKKFKSTLMWSMQEYNKSYGANKSTILQNIFVADLLYKYTPSFSTRLELQYLITHEDQKDWMAALLEVNFAPSWSIYVSDMWNHGSTKLHYYNGGVSYTKSRTRLALGYGRFKDGYICSGGVCRTVPAYTGFNLTVTTSF